MTAARQRSKSTPASALLAWYDRHRRVLPWRAKPDEQPDPYRVWLSEIMLQQTTVQAVGRYYREFLARWPDVQALAAAPLDDVLAVWSGLGYYSRARNLHRAAQQIAERHGGHLPRASERLRALHGGRGGLHRVRRSGAGGGRERGAGALSAGRRRGRAGRPRARGPPVGARGGAGPGRAARGLQPGADGVGRDGMPAGGPVVPALPVEG